MRIWRGVQGDGSEDGILSQTQRAPSSNLLEPKASPPCFRLR